MILSVNIITFSIIYIFTYIRFIYYTLIQSYFSRIFLIFTTYYSANVCFVINFRETNYWKMSTLYAQTRMQNDVCAKQLCTVNCECARVLKSKFSKFAANAASKYSARTSSCADLCNYIYVYMYYIHVYIYIYIVRSTRMFIPVWCSRERLYRQYIYTIN